MKGQPRKKVKEINLQNHVRMLTKRFGKVNPIGSVWRSILEIAPCEDNSVYKQALSRNGNDVSRKGLI